MNYGVQNIHAYTFIQQRGTIAVDDNGNVLSTAPGPSYIIYVETKGPAINWKFAWKQDKPYSVIATLIKKTPFEVGINKETNAKIILAPVGGNSLWQLELVPYEKNMPAPAPTNTKGIMLQGELKNKTFIQKTGKPIELLMPDAV